MLEILNNNAFGRVGIYRQERAPKLINQSVYQYDMDLCLNVLDRLRASDSGLQMGFGLEHRF